MHHCYEPIMQRLLNLQIEYKTLILAADTFKHLERPDLVIADEEYGELIGRIDEACKNMRVVSEDLGKVAWENVEMKKVGKKLAKAVMLEVEKKKGSDGGKKDADEDAVNCAAVGGGVKI